MVAFGKKLRESQIQEWKEYYINYKFMKKKVKRYTEQIEVGAQNHHNVLRDFSLLLDNQVNIYKDMFGLVSVLVSVLVSCLVFVFVSVLHRQQVLENFFSLLEFQIEKIVLFLLEQQGVLAGRLSHIGEDHQNLLQKPDCSKISEIQEAYRQVGRDLLKLLYFVEMNATGLRKILKKFDKRFGYKFADYYVKTRANHPYSQLRQVLRHVGIGAVVGVLSHNLADIHDLQRCQGSYISIYDQPSYAHQDPILVSIKAASDKLSNSTSFLQFLGRHAFIMQQEELSPSPSEENTIDERYHFMSLLLNLASTFLYMVNTYIVVPTADNYSLNLGAAASVCGVVIGSMAVAQVFASVYFSAWSNRSYLKPLIFSTIVLLIGNVMYALAYDLNSVVVLLMGRLFCGLGSARAVNRRYISDCVPLKLRMQASAGFVSASALGMACGPAIACLLQTEFRIYKLTMNQDTLPGWVMAVAWLVYLLWLCTCFKEPETVWAYEPETGEQTVHIAVENSPTQPLLINPEAKQQDVDVEEENNDDEEVYDKTESQKPVTSIALAYKLLTPSVKVQLFVYFMLKYAMEILLAESSLVTEYYFVWSTTKVAIFLACLGLTVLPVNIIIGSYISNIFEERQVLLTSEIMVCIGLLLSFHTFVPYSVTQYVGSALITFVSAEVLEGVNLSLLSKMMSSRLSRGTFNGGLLSTEAGTLARVIADGTITIVGYFSESKLLNATLLPALLICISSIAATCCTYNSLY